jgi:uncharacterized protein YndB with AHSA1/START domain
MTQTPTKPGRPTSPLTSHQFALSTVADPAAVWSALTHGDLTRRYLNGLAAYSTWTPGAPLTFRSGGETAGPLTAGQPTAGPLTAGPLTGQVLRAEPPRQLSYLLQSGPQDPPTFLSWRLRATAGGTTLRLQIDEFDGSSDDEAEDTWLPILAALRTLLDPVRSGPGQPAEGQQDG